jgi:2-polyprenyl-3-methyl-5-hydroxy-6-metoxy-1,4-benzoquinol methylase
MALHIDPEENEFRTLQKVADWTTKRVLEIGCGEGRLSLRLARLGATVHAIDPDAKLIRNAKANLPKSFSKQVTFRSGKAERLAYKNEAFDSVIFAWSL